MKFFVLPLYNQHLEAAIEFDPDLNSEPNIDLERVEESS